MQSTITFLLGPALWITFIIFFGGLAVRLGYLFWLSRKKDRIVYNHFSLSWGLKSIFHWIVPWASHAMRRQPGFTFVAFTFHICLLGVPLFLNAHNVMWQERFDFSLWSLPDGLADTLTVAMIVAGIILWIRRLQRPEVRILTGAWDYFLLALVMSPFVTGFLAYHQWGPYQPMMILHILLAEILLILIPFTKLGHMVLFFFTRAFIGFEMGQRRGTQPW